MHSSQISPNFEKKSYHVIDPVENRKGILIATSEIVMATQLVMWLKDLGNEPITMVSSADEALNLAAKIKPCAILVDIPFLGRRDCIRAAGRLQTEYEIPVILLAGYADKMLISILKKTNPFSFLTKPIERQQLQTVIAHVQRQQSQSFNKDHTPHLMVGTNSIPGHASELEGHNRPAASERYDFMKLSEELSCILKTRDEKKVEFDKTALSNIKELILPVIEKLKAGPLSVEKKALIDQLEENLGQISSPFVFELSNRFFDLSPTELRIAQYIKNGLQTKEIARLLDLEISTINTHRDKIRHKLGIKNKKINLKTYLQAFRDKKT